MRAVGSPELCWGWCWDASHCQPCAGGALIHSMLSWGAAIVSTMGEAPLLQKSLGVAAVGFVA